MTTAAINLGKPVAVGHTARELRQVNAVCDDGLLGAVMDTDAGMVSFDIFDTVLTRDVGEPFALFYRIGEEIARRGLVDCPPLMFVQVRYANEQRARTNKDGREVSLREIYEEVAQVLNCESLIDEMVEIEMDAEAASLRVVPQAIPAVEAARSRFGRVVFISDMYLSHDFIRHRLIENGLFRKGDRLYVSSEFGIQKGDGRLFKHVLAEEKLNPRRLLHCGDSMRYDIEPARKLGIRTFHSRIAIPHPSEEALNRRTSWNGGFGSGLAGASRLARLGCSEADPHRRIMWETGATVTGPFVLLYARWILARCAAQGIRQICFLARDGYFPYLAVRELLAAEPECGVSALYIHGSRPTYLALGAASLGEEEWNELTVHGGVSCRTIRDIASALMTSEATLEKFLPGLGFGEADLEKPLADHELESVRRAAIDDPAFNAALTADLKAYRERFSRYLKQEGFDPEMGTALVDSGWTTRSHAPLFRFIEGLGCRKLKLLYIGVMVDETHVPVESVEAFVFDMARRRGPISRTIYYARPCEALLFAEHGRTIGFEVKGERVVPVLAEPENPKALKEGFESYHGGILAFLRQVISTMDGGPGPFGVADLAQQVISRFWCEPTVEEARAWAKMDWQWDPQGRVTYPFARKYRLTDLGKAFVQRRCPQCYPQFWVAGSAALTGKRVLLAIRATGKIARHIHDLFRRLPGPIRRSMKRMIRLVRRGKEHGTFSASAMMALEIAPYLAK